MIYLLSTRTYPAHEYYQQVDFNHFHAWVTQQESYQLDIETNVVDDITLREIYVVQFGNLSGDVQYVLDVASFDQAGIDYVIKILADNKPLKLIHNARFEYTVIKQCYKVDINNMFCTQLATKVMVNGKSFPAIAFPKGDGKFKKDEAKYASLRYCLKAFLGVDISKDAQTSFTGEPMNLEQIVYAAQDVMYLHAIRMYLQRMSDYETQAYTVHLENQAVRGYGDVEAHGFILNKEKWLANIDWMQPKVDECIEIINSQMLNELREECEGLGFVQQKDEISINWNSGTQKKEILSVLYPDLEQFTKPALKKYEITIEEDDNPIYFLIEKEFDKLNDYMLTHHRQLLVDTGHFIAKDTILINLNSPKQKLQLFQLVEPELTSTGADVIENIDHPMINAFRNYNKYVKYIGTYGTNWFDFIGTDGRVRAGQIQQVLETGRISMSEPGIMTVPADEGYFLGNRYREPFEPTAGWKIVASDYKSQELAIIAYLANEKVWLKAIENGWDVHSVCAALVFKQKWIDAGGHPTGEKKPKSTDLEALELRSQVKAINFGLAYGGGPGLLSKRLNLSMDQARQLIKDYFEAFPSIKGYFKTRAEFGVKFGYIETAPPFKRRRYFPMWDENYIEHKDRASIERQSKNTSIQGTAADGAKAALVFIKSYIENNNLSDKVRILMTLHDAVVTEAHPDYYEEWAKTQNELMIQGHDLNIPGRIIGCDTAITDYWTK